MNPIMDPKVPLEKILRGLTPPFRVTDLPSVWDLEDQLEWQVEGMVPKGGITIICGDSGVGKSTLGLYLCSRVATGESVLSRSTSRSKVLYVDGENPLSVVKDRVERLRIPRSQDLLVWGGWCDPSPAGPNSPLVVDFAAEHKGLIVYDSLIAFHSGSEQDATETRRYFQHFRKLANLGATVIVMHHTGKGESSAQYRGSSDIKGAVDHAFTLKLQSERDDGSKLLRLVPFKERAARVEPITFEWRDDGFTETQAFVDSDRTILRQIIRANPHKSQSELVALATEEGIGKARCEKLLAEGRRDGTILADPGANNSKLHRLPGQPEMPEARTNRERNE